MLPNRARINLRFSGTDPNTQLQGFKINALFLPEFGLIAAKGLRCSRVSCSNILSILTKERTV
jgi:hypothetical protein